MNRKTTNIAGSSIGFMNMLVQPAYEALVSVIPDAQICLDYLEENKAKWEEQKEEFKKRMETDQNYIPESRGLIIEKESLLPSIMSKKN